MHHQTPKSPRRQGTKVTSSPLHNRQGDLRCRHRCRGNEQPRADRHHGHALNRGVDVSAQTCELVAVGGVTGANVQAGGPYLAINKSRRCSLDSN